MVHNRRLLHVSCQHGFKRDASNLLRGPLFSRVFFPSSLILFIWFDEMARRGKKKNKIKYFSFGYELRRKNKEKAEGKKKGKFVFNVL